MGNAARRRAERKPSRAPAPPEMLEEAVKAIGNHYGTDARCAEAAYTLKHAAQMLGYDLTLRPVSLIASDNRNGRTAILGPKAAALLSDEQRESVHDMRPAGMDLGHMVLTGETPPTLYDPNLGQLRAMGIMSPMSLMERIFGTHPEDEQWDLKSDSIDLGYLIDDDNRALLEDFDDLFPHFEEKARELVRMIRGGAKAHQLSW